MSRPLVYRATGQENGVRTRRVAKRVSFASGTTTSRGPLASRDLNVEHRLPTPGKLPRKATENDDLNESLSQAYTALRLQYDSLNAEMKQLHGSPDKEKLSKYQDVLAEKQRLEEELHEQRQLLSFLLTQLDYIFPDILQSDEAVKRGESDDNNEEAISLYVNHCIGTVAAQLERENEQRDELQISDRAASSDSGILSSTPLQCLPSPVEADGNEESFSRVIISPPSQFAEETAADPQTNTSIDSTTDCPATPFTKDQTPPPFNNSMSSTCSDTWSSCVSTPSLVAPPSTPQSSKLQVSTPNLSSQLCGALISRLNASSCRESSLFGSDITPDTEVTSLSESNENQDFVLSFPADCSPVSKHDHLTLHDQSVQAVSSPIMTVDHGTEMMPVETIDQGISTSPLMTCDVAMETVPIETHTVATEMCPPPVNPYQVKCTELEMQATELRRELTEAQQRIEKMSPELEEFHLQDSYKDCYYLELEKNRIFEEELSAYHALVKKVEEVEIFHAEFVGKTQQVKEVVDKYTEENQLLKGRVQLLEQQLADSHKKLTKLQRRESQLVTELGKLLVELTTVKSQLQVTNEKLTTETEKAEKYECESEQLATANKKLKEELETTNQAAIVAVETLQADVQKLEKQLSEKCQELKDMSTQSSETQEFLEAERLTMCEELTTLHSAARRSMLQQDEELHAVARAIKLLWDKFHDTVNVLSIRTGKETSQHMMALKRRKLLTSESLVDRVLAGKMRKSVNSNNDEWGDETYVGFGHLMSRITKLQEMVAELQELASWKQLRERIDTLDKEKSELSSELGKCQIRIQHAVRSLDETKENLKRRDQQYRELQDTFMGTRSQQELQKVKEKKQRYKNRLKELAAFGEEYQSHMERKVELLKSNLAKSEAEVLSLDRIVEHARKTLHVCFGIVKTNPKLEKLLCFLDGTTTVE